MKNRKLFSKLLSVLSAFSLLCGGSVSVNHVKALECKTLVDHFYSHTIPCSPSHGIWLFAGQDEKIGKYGDSGNAPWRVFLNMMATEYKPSFMPDFWCTDTVKDSDSVAFVYLVLHLYNQWFIAKKNDGLMPKDARNVARVLILMLWMQSRTPNERQRDRKILKELIDYHSENRSVSHGSEYDVEDELVEGFTKLKKIVDELCG